eukprot:6176620-Pleurochrysis_carterae.AAC.4
MLRDANETLATEPGDDSARSQTASRAHHPRPASQRVAQARGETTRRSSCPSASVAMATTRPFKRKRNLNAPAQAAARRA